MLGSNPRDKHGEVLEVVKKRKPHSRNKLRGHKE
jgi:hypothetical protein